MQPITMPCMWMLPHSLPVAKELRLPLAAGVAVPRHRLCGMWLSPSHSPCGLVHWWVLHLQPDTSRAGLVKHAQPGISFHMFEVTPASEGSHCSISTLR